MLPKLELRRTQTEKEPRGAHEVVALPRLRLLRQVTHEGRQHGAFSPRSPAVSVELEASKRGRAMRPGRDKGRSPSPMRQRRVPEDQNYTPHHDAQQRVRQHLRQKRRKAKEEEELRALEEKERQERLERSLPQVEAYRRDLGRKAAEMHRRERAEKETAQVQQEQLASARRERVNRYMTPDAINGHLGRFDMEPRVEDRQPVGSSVRALRLDPEEDVVVCGSFATGSVRARNKVMLSPRRQDRQTRRKEEWKEDTTEVHPEAVHPEAAQGAALRAEAAEPIATPTQATEAVTEATAEAPARQDTEAEADASPALQEVSPAVPEPSTEASPGLSPEVEIPTGDPQPPA